MRLRDDVTTEARNLLLYCAVYSSVLMFSCWFGLWVVCIFAWRVREHPFSKPWLVTPKKTGIHSQLRSEYMIE